MGEGKIKEPAKREHPRSSYSYVFIEDSSTLSDDELATIVSHLKTWSLREM